MLEVALVLVAKGIGLGQVPHSEDVAALDGRNDFALATAVRRALRLRQPIDWREHGGLLAGVAPHWHCGQFTLYEQY